MGERVKGYSTGNTIKVQDIADCKLKVCGIRPSQTQVRVVLYSTVQGKFLCDLTVAKHVFQVFVFVAVAVA